MKLSLVLILMSSLVGTVASAKNFHRIDEDETSGYGMYRTGKPSLNDFKELCALGVDQMIVLSGDAEQYELKYRDRYCPQMKIIYNEKQSASVALDENFLKQFDEWVAVAKLQGKKIAFRCQCGCHRTGRLAAYYQMKYQRITAVDAIAVMYEHGKHMYLHPGLVPQVRALEEYLQNKACTQKERYCVRR